MERRRMSWFVMQSVRFEDERMHPVRALAAQPDNGVLLPYPRLLSFL
jgi:hypothetical protein